MSLRLLGLGLVHMTLLGLVLGGCWWAGEEPPPDEPAEAAGDEAWAEVPGTSSSAPSDPDPEPAVEVPDDPPVEPATPVVSQPPATQRRVAAPRVTAPRQPAPRRTQARATQQQRREERQERRVAAPRQAERQRDTGTSNTSSRGGRVYSPDPAEPDEPPSPPVDLDPLIESFSADVAGPDTATDLDPSWKGPRSGADWLQIAWECKADGDLEGATEALHTALEWGADPQVVHLELGYLAQQQGDEGAAREHFKEAHHAAMERVRQARGEMRRGNRPYWGEFYADAFGWHRFMPEKSTNIVPTLRLRGYLHPIPDVDLDPYVFVQLSRDAASRGRGPQGYPLIYADNSLMIGGGVLFRFWQLQVGLFVQIGPSFKLVDDDRDAVELDFRAGGYLDLAAPTCFPRVIDDGRGSALIAEPCAELYAELVYVSRFDHNLMGQVRGRVGLTYLLTGPVAWQPLAEGRVYKDIDNDFWNNMADGGVGHRWRLLQPFALDLMLGVHFGTYFGFENLDPAPEPLSYAELRLQAATGFVF